MVPEGFQIIQDNFLSLSRLGKAISPLLFVREVYMKKTFLLVCERSFKSCFLHLRGTESLHRHKKLHAHITQLHKL